MRGARRVGTSRGRDVDSAAALATLDDMLVGVVETLAQARRLSGLPSSVREAVEELETAATRLQAITEWASEGRIEVRSSAPLSESR